MYHWVAWQQLYFEMLRNKLHFPEAVYYLFLANSQIRIWIMWHIFLDTTFISLFSGQCSSSFKNIIKRPLLEQMQSLICGSYLSPGCHIFYQYETFFINRLTYKSIHKSPSKAAPKTSHSQPRGLKLFHNKAYIGWKNFLVNSAIYSYGFGSPNKIYSVNTPFLKMTGQELDCSFQVQVILPKIYVREKFLHRVRDERWK